MKRIFTRYKKKLLVFIAIIIFFCVVIKISVKKEYLDMFTYQYIKVPLENIKNLFSKEDQKIEKLLQEINQLQSLETTNAVLTNEIKQLKQLLELESISSNYSKTIATVIERDVEQWGNEVIINVGENKGAFPNMGVITELGLIGFIKTVNKETSVVKLLTSVTSFSFPVMILNGDSYVYGIFSGYDVEKNLYKVQLLEYQEEEVIGKKLVTSSYSSYTPSGVEIGTVEKIEVVNTVFYAYATPSVNYRQIQYVYLISKE